ncbi:unnamed protein product [Owenia fusiformis]|uniref:Uncharacterized protein n=1 Tax=Owenia fusiformis TaxID=6347 RepID=A0A8J1YB36_OWEFU|nr:unnamed protein product [Owenia fusiformis]
MLKYQGIYWNSLIGLAFAAAAGITLLVLGCALPQYNNWWPMFVLFFYVLSPVPTIISRRLADSLESSNALTEAMIFTTAAIVVSAYGLPVVLAHTPVGSPIISLGAMALVMAGNTVSFGTILAYFIVFNEDSMDYSSW